jgi:hypothetical protein
MHAGKSFHPPLIFPYIQIIVKIATPYWIIQLMFPSAGAILSEISGNDG